MKTLNLNSLVKVKLTDYGEKCFRDSQPDSVKLPKVDEQGYVEFQLWVLMNIFGDCMHNGTDVPFDGVHIKFSEKYLE